MSKTKFVNVKLNFVDINLTLQESVVLSYLASLTKKDYCFATNDHLCETLEINNRTLFRIFSKLEDYDLIRRETKSIGKYGKDRRIYVNPRVKLAYHSK